MRPSTRTAGGRRTPGAKDAAAPWRWGIDARTLWIVPDQACRVLSWAPLGGGIRIARVLANHQVELDDREAMRAPRALTVLEAGIESVRSGARATGTDCIAIAAPVRARARDVRAQRYCGKHTLLGELIGRAVLASCAQAIRRIRGTAVKSEK